MTIACCAECCIACATDNAQRCAKILKPAALRFEIVQVLLCTMAMQDHACGRHMNAQELQL